MLLGKASSNATLVFSFVGYKTQEVAVKGKATVNVTLHEDSHMLEETVVIVTVVYLKRILQDQLFFEK